MPDKPIRPLVLAHHIKAAAECPVGSQNPENLPIGGFLVRKSMKAVQRQNDVEGVVCIGECSHISLPEGYIFQVQAVSLFQIGVVFRLVHCPHQAAHRFPAQSRAGDHAVIKTVSARHSVRTANGFFSFHGFLSVFQSSHDRFRSHFFKMSTIFAKSSFASLKIGSIQ